MNYEKVENLEYQDPMEQLYKTCNDIISITNAILTKDEDFKIDIKKFGEKDIIVFPVSDETNIELLVLVIGADINKSLCNDEVTSLSMWFSIASQEHEFSDETCFDMNVFPNKISYYCGICPDTINTINKEDAKKILDWVDQLMQYCTKLNSGTEDNHECTNSTYDNGVAFSTRNLTDEESEIYEKWLNAEAEYTGEHLL